MLSSSIIRLSLPLLKWDLMMVCMYQISIVLHENEYYIQLYSYEPLYIANGHIGHIVPQRLACIHLLTLQCTVFIWFIHLGCRSAQQVLGNAMFRHRRCRYADVQ